jgi:hypothetical protein
MALIERDRRETVVLVGVAIPPVSVEAAEASLEELAALADTAGAEGGIPIRFRFEPIGQNYLFATFQKPRIHDDFIFAVTALASLQDLSGLVAPSLSWSAKEWLTLTASAFLPFPGPSSLAATDPRTGKAISEYGLAPLAWRGLFEAKVFY